MIKVCSTCSGMSVEDLKKALNGVEVEDGCIYECGSEFAGYVSEELITADSEEDFVKQAQEQLNK